jgi:hypothetical protein
VPVLVSVSGRSSGVQEFRSSGVQEFRSSGVQEFRSSGVQEFRSSGCGMSASAGRRDALLRIRLCAVRRRGTREVRSSGGGMSVEISASGGARPTDRLEAYATLLAPQSNYVTEAQSIIGFQPVPVPPPELL